MKRILEQFENQSKLLLCQAKELSKKLPYSMQSIAAELCMIVSSGRSVKEASKLFLEAFESME
jgi:hypothetical protein